MSSEGLPVNNVVGTNVELAPRSTADAANAASSSQAADSAAASADRAWKFSNDSAASAAAAKVSETNAAASANDTVKKSVVTTQALLGPISITDALSINAKSETGNANLFFTDSDKSETNAIYSNGTGQMSIRVGKGLYTHQLHTDGFIEPSSGIRLSTRAFSYTDIQGSTGSINFGSNGYLLRGKDIASFDDLNNVNICSWNGIGFVPTTTAGLEANVTQGKPSVIINARTGRVSSKNGFYTDGIINIKTGDYGIGTVNSSSVLDFTKLSTPAGLYRGIEGQTGAPAGASVMAGTSVSVTGSYTGHIYAGHGATPGTIKLYVGWVRSNGTADWVSAWHSGNTTVDANGFIKKASPIVKLFGTGESELNDESQDVTTERVSEGVYRISGTLGFNADAEWGGVDGGIEIPTDRNKLPLVWVDYEVDATGDLLIKTFHRVNSTAPKFAQNVKVGYKEGQPIDIPAGRWIDLRVEMPGGDEPEYEPVPEDKEVPEVTPEVTEPEGGEEPAPGEVPAPIEEPKE